MYRLTKPFAGECKSLGLKTEHLPEVRAWRDADTKHLGFS